VRAILPAGNLLPDDIWRQRHRVIVAILWAHAIALPAYGLVRGYAPLHVLLESGVVAAAAAFASWSPAGRTLRSAVSTLGLVTSSAVLVHLSGGYIEAHFHFFVVLGLITLYQSWVPFLLAIGYVVVHHGVLGTLVPSAVYNHPDALAEPWKWSLVHSAFVVAASGAYLAAWRLTEHQALHDALTKLPNRLLFNDRLEHALALGARRKADVGVVFVDLDNFKEVNDTFGHAAGDELLVGVAGRLTGCLRSSDTLARLGGDEFAVILDQVSRPGEAVLTVERIMRELDRPFTLRGKELVAHASAGVVTTQALPSDSSEVLRSADTAMYLAKRRGKGRYVVFHDGMEMGGAGRATAEAELREAIEQDQLMLHYQPIVELASRRVVGVEALVRWQHPERGLLAPDEFIPQAESTGLILPLGRWVLREACREAVRWHADGPASDPWVSVNVSGLQLGATAFRREVVSALEESGLPASRLVLEITETVAMGDAEETHRRLQELKGLGVRIAIDDFGVGYSSLAYLQRFSIDILKIDRTFVSDLEQDAGSRRLVAGISALAHGLRLEVVAEGVETEQQRERLLRCGADFVQGFLMHRPMEAEAVRALLMRGSADLVAAGTSRGRDGQDHAPLAGAPRHRPPAGINSI